MVTCITLGLTYFHMLKLNGTITYIEIEISGCVIAVIGQLTIDRGSSGV